MDPINVVVALAIYTVALMTRVVSDGLSAVPLESTLAAEALGFTKTQNFVRVQLPLSVPAVIRGMRVVVVTNISIATMAAAIGVSQLGTLFTIGFSRNQLTPIITGIIACLLLSLVLDRLLVWLGKIVTPWQTRAG